jgi:hypothetical protein
MDVHAAELPHPATGSRLQPDRRSPFRRSTIATWILGAGIFFRRSFASGFDGLSGDNGDWRLISVLHEHLFKALRGSGSWNNPNFFYPTKNVLGYSDTFALNEIFYVPLRLLGFDRYAALQWTFIILTAVGFFGITALLDRSTMLPNLWICCLAATFTFANSLAIKAGHPQMYGVYWLPWVMLMVTLSQKESSRRRYALLAGAGSLSALVLYSSFYIGWFFLLSVGIWTVYFSILQLATEGFRPYVAHLRSELKAGAALLAGFVVSLAPFIYTYLPALRATRKRAYSEAMGFAGRPGDLINVSKWNVVWGPFLRRIFEARPGRLANGETALAITPLVIVLSLFVGFYGFRTKRSQRSPRQNLVLGLAFTLVTMSLLSIKFGFGSAWIVPYTVVPGANAIRAIDRIQVFNLILAALTLSLGLDLWLDGTKTPNRTGPDRSRHTGRTSSAAGSRTAPTLLSVLLVLAVAEQFNRSPQSSMDRSDELRLVIATPDAPKTCRSFYIVGLPGAPAYVTNIDAMVIASSKELPTLNGYSGQFPDAFPFDTTLPTYVQDIQGWAQRNGVAQGLCSYDHASRTWSAVPLST